MSRDDKSIDEDTGTDRVRNVVRRREVLASLGATSIAALAGCTGGGGGGDSTDTTADSGGGDATETTAGSGDGGGSTETTGTGTDGDSTQTASPTATATPDPNRITLDFWTLFAGGDGATMKQIINTFNEESDEIQIRRQRIPWDQYYTKLYTALTGGNAPDLAVCHLSRMQRFGRVFEPMSDLLEESSYYPRSFQEATYEGEVRSAPLDILAVGTYYNKTVFEDAGLDPEQSMGSWSDYKEKINTIVSETDKIGYGVGGALHGNRVYYPWISQLGSPILEETDGGWEMGFNNDHGTKVTETVQKMRADWNWFPKNDAEAIDQFQNSGTAAINGGTWDYNNYKDSELEWGFMKAPPAPGMGTDGNKTWSNSHSIGVPRNQNRSSEKTEAAKQAAKTITQDYGIVWGKSAGHIPNATKARENQSLREAPVWDKTMSTWFNMMENNEFFYVPRTTSNGQYHEAIYQPINAVRTGNLEPQNALDQIQSNIQSIQF